MLSAFLKPQLDCLYVDSKEVKRTYFSSLSHEKLQLVHFGVPSWITGLSDFEGRWLSFSVFRRRC